MKCNDDEEDENHRRKFMERKRIEKFSNNSYTTLIIRGSGPLLFIIISWCFYTFQAAFHFQAISL